MSANSKQVAGTHYQPVEGGVQHWDYCVRSNTPNLEYAASKYLSRWRKKNGLQDLEKALHYVEKRLESIKLHVGALRGGSLIQPLFTKFLTDNNISTPESIILYQMMHWKRAEELEQSAEQIKLLIAKEAAEILENTPTSVLMKRAKARPMSELMDEEEAEATAAYVN